MDGFCQNRRCLAHDYHKVLCHVHFPGNDPKGIPADPKDPHGKWYRLVAAEHFSSRDEALAFYEKHLRSRSFPACEITPMYSDL